MLSCNNKIEVSVKKLFLTGKVYFGFNYRKFEVNCNSYKCLIIIHVSFF